MDLKRYWLKVREIEKTLPAGEDPIYLVSIDNELTGAVAGRVSVAASREYAARWIAKRDCDLASPEQIEQYKSDLAGRTAAIVKFELEKKQTVRLETAIAPEQLQEAIAIALADQPAKPAKSSRQS